MRKSENPTNEIPQLLRTTSFESLGNFIIAFLGLMTVVYISLFW